MLAVIECTYKLPAGTDPYLVELLSLMEMPSSLQAATPFHFVVNEREIKMAWMKQRERTAEEERSQAW